MPSFEDTMPQLKECPTLGQLQQLESGDRQEGRDAIFDHIDVCHRCADVFGNLEEKPDEWLGRFVGVTPEELDRVRAEISKDTSAGLEVSAVALVLRGERNGRV